MVSLSVPRLMKQLWGAVDGGLVLLASDLRSSASLRWTWLWCHLYHHNCIKATLHQSHFADSCDVLKVGILGITETVVYFWAIPQMSIQGGQKCVIGRPDDEAQSCLWNLPHVGPSYGLVGDCFPGCPPSLPPLAHSFDPVWLILNSDDFRDHQLLPLFLCSFWPHLWGRCLVTTTQLSLDVVNDRWPGQLLGGISLSSPGLLRAVP